MMKIDEQKIRIACEFLTETLVAKNKDYGNSVEEQFNEYGDTSLLIRLDDKLRRLKQLQKAPANVTGESKRDTMLDLAGYAILGLLCLSSEEERTYEVPKKGYLPAIKPTIIRVSKSPFEEMMEKATFTPVNYDNKGRKSPSYDINFNPHFDTDDQ